MIVSIWVLSPLLIGLYTLNEDLVKKSFQLQPSYTYCFLDFSATDPVVVTGMIAAIVFLSLPIFFMTYAYSKIILFYKEMNRKKKKTSAAVS